MAKRKYKDFDKMFSEIHHDTTSLKVYGKFYTIEKAIPAEFVLELAKYENTEDIPETLLIKTGRRIFGEKALKEWCNHSDFTADMLGEIIKWAFTEIMGKGEDEEEEEDFEELTEDDMGASATTKRKN